MLDARVRPALAPALDRVAAALDRPGVTPDRLSVAGLVVGLACAGLAAAQLWPIAFVLWGVSRLLDGLDGPLARRRGTHAGTAGGFLDICVDFVVYGATALGVAVGVWQGESDPGLGTWLPFAVVLLAYYVNGAAFLAFSSAAAGTGHALDDGRTFSFLGGLAEGTETVAVHALWLLLPAYAVPLAWVWAAVVGVSATQRIVGGRRILRRPAS